MVSTFSVWIDQQLQNRGWSQSEAARRGKFSPSLIQQVISGETNPGPKFCLGLARAFQISAEEVYRLAGLLPAKIDDHGPVYHIGNNLDERLARAFGRLALADQELVVALAERLAGLVAGRIIGEE